MTLVAGVDSSTQSCKVVVRDLETGAVVRTGRAAHPDGTEVDPGRVVGCAARRDRGRGRPRRTSPPSRSAASSTAWSCSMRTARSSATPCSGTTPAPRRRARPDRRGRRRRIRAARGLVPVASSRSPSCAGCGCRTRERGARRGRRAPPRLADLAAARLRPRRREPARPGARRAHHRPLGRERHRLLQRGHRRVRPRPARPRAPSRRRTQDSSDAVLPRVLAAGDTAGDARPRSPAFLTAVVGAGAGDNAGAALGLGAADGDVVVSIGTSGTVFAVTDTPSATRPARSPDSPTRAASTCRSSRPSTPPASSIDRRLLGVDHAALGRARTAAEPGAGGVVLHPYFEGERTPEPAGRDRDPPGLTLASTTRGTSRARRSRACCAAWPTDSTPSRASASRRRAC